MEVAFDWNQRMASQGDKARRQRLIAVNAVSVDPTLPSASDRYSSRLTDTEIPLHGP